MRKRQANGLFVEHAAERSVSVVTDLPSFGALRLRTDAHALKEARVRHDAVPVTRIDQHGPIRKQSVEFVARQLLTRRQPLAFELHADDPFGPVHPLGMLQQAAADVGHIPCAVEIRAHREEDHRQRMEVGVNKPRKDRRPRKVDVSRLDAAAVRPLATCFQPAHEGNSSVLRHKAFRTIPVLRHRHN